jgi:tRNA(fMet)-specific endonuclease VapC
MLRYLFDTDHLTMFQHGHVPVARRLLSQPSGSVGISVVTIEEALRGRLAQLGRARDGPARIRQYELLAQSIRLFVQFPMIAFDQASESNFQQFRSIRIGTQDRKIASIALASQLILVTANRRDFARVPGLVLEDWSV